MHEGSLRTPLTLCETFPQLCKLFNHPSDGLTVITQPRRSRRPLRSQPGMQHRQMAADISASQTKGRSSRSGRDRQSLSVPFLDLGLIFLNRSSVCPLLGISQCGCEGPAPSLPLSLRARQVVALSDPRRFGGRYTVGDGGDALVGETDDLL